MDLLKVEAKTFYHWQDLFGTFFKEHTKAELCKEALARGIVLIPANTPKDLLEDPQLKARNYWEEIKHPELGTAIRYPGALYKSSEMTWKFDRAPMIGEHNQDILEKELDFSKQTLSLLKQNGVI